MARKPIRAGCATLAFAMFLAAGCESSPPLPPGPAPLNTAFAARKEYAGRADLLDKIVKGESQTNAARLGTPQDTAPAAPAPAPIQTVSALGPSAGKGAAGAESRGPAAPPGNLVAHPSAPDPSSPPLTLTAAIETGLTQNPDLAALRENEGVSAALLGVARTYPFNPIFQTRYLPWGRNPDGTNTTPLYYFLLWQTFELANQRQFRKEFAAAGLENTRWTIQQAALQNVALTAQLYFAALYQHGLRELAQRTAQLNDELLAVTERRFKGGRSSASDLALVRIDANSTRQQARLADLVYRNALLALRRQLNLPDDAPLDVEGSLTDYAWHPVTGAELARLTEECVGFTDATGGEALVAQLAGGRPDVLAARANFEAARANLGLARAARVPNLTIGPFYEHDTAAVQSYGFQAQMEIPVANTGRPLVRQRQAELRQRQVAVDQMEAKARVEVGTALRRYEQARVLCEQTRPASGQQMPGELGKLEEEFRKGEIDILRISQARNSLLLYRRTYLDSLNELALAAAALTAATGLPPAALVSPPGGAAALPCGKAAAPGQLPAACVPAQPVK